MIKLTQQKPVGATPKLILGGNNEQQGSDLKMAAKTAQGVVSAKAKCAPMRA